jgi:outer membrane protein assembly factor BamB
MDMAYNPAMRTLLILLCLAPPLSAASWPQWRGPNRDGVAPDSPPLVRLGADEALAPAWISDPLPSEFEGGWGCPVVEGGRVYLYLHTKKTKPGVKLPPAKYPWMPLEKSGMTPKEYEEYEVKRRDEDEVRAKAEDFTETLHCLDARTGKTIWSKPRPSVYARFVQSSTPAIADGRIITLGSGRMVRCMDADTGDLVWESRVPGDYRDEIYPSSFVIVDGVAVALIGSIVGLDIKSGAVLWQGDAKTASGSYSSPVVWTHGGKPHVVAHVAGQSTACFEPRSGRELWRVRSMAGGMSTPVIRGDLMITYGPSRRSGIRAFTLSPTGAEELWNYSGLQDQGSSPVLIGDHLYAQGERKLACIDAKTGDEKWVTELKLRNPQFTSLVAADGKVLYAYETLLWFAADPAGFKPLAQVRLDEAGVIATEATHRARLKLDEVKDEKEAEKIYRNKVERHGPVACSTPAIADGRLYVRIKNGLACYVLTP